MAKHNPSLYHAIHGLRHGRLHRVLGISEDQTIPEDRLRAAANSKNESTARMANFALTLKGFKHKGPKKK